MSRIYFFSLCTVNVFTHFHVSRWSLQGILWPWVFILQVLYSAISDLVGLQRRLVGMQLGPPTSLRESHRLASSSAPRQLTGKGALFRGDDTWNATLLHMPVLWSGSLHLRPSHQQKTTLRTHLGVLPACVDSLHTWLLQILYSPHSSEGVGSVRALKDT